MGLFASIESRDFFNAWQSSIGIDRLDWEQQRRRRNTAEENASSTQSPEASVARVLYASPSWWGLTNEYDRTRLEWFYNRLKQLEYIPGNALNIIGLVAQGDERLFGYIEEIQNMYFTIYSLNRSSGHYDLRPRPHEYVLPQKNDNNFVEWYLFKLSMNTKPPDDRDN